MNVIIKYQLTHDFTVNQSPNNSPNYCLNWNKLLELICGWCLLLLLDYSYTLRLAELEIAILISKIDPKAAHRCY